MVRGRARCRFRAAPADGAGPAGSCLPWIRRRPPPAWHTELLERPVEPAVPDRRTSGHRAFDAACREGVGPRARVLHLLRGRGADHVRLRVLPPVALERDARLGPAANDSGICGTGGPSGGRLPVTPRRARSDRRVAAARFAVGRVLGRHGGAGAAISGPMPSCSLLRSLRCPCCCSTDAGSGP